MEDKLKELVGQPCVWLYIKSSNGWFKNVEILDVSAQTVTFRYESESETDRKLWEKTTRISNVAEIEIRLVSIPKANQQLTDIRVQLSKLLNQDSASDFENPAA
ncbi:hypothetical protein IQ241_19890 [Romeria aff. gracilis LEGE 07310]|uniref:Uncharacterized protein n=1 Tax=Vasconcelosia minhoensis LEGE 07310 TaxID=915328 RepID=A0A8J7ASI3_9CYAN|nr:DUF6679 family protein [Romeria gracilis]MBE9079530.1 hypothetical protein [Romeria aff. gracilis LEGE 07310]